MAVEPGGEVRADPFVADCAKEGDEIILVLAKFTECLINVLVKVIAEGVNGGFFYEHADHDDGLIANFQVRPDGAELFDDIVGGVAAWHGQSRPELAGGAPGADRGFIGAVTDDAIEIQSEEFIHDGWYILLRVEPGREEGSECEWQWQDAALRAG